MIYCLLQLNPSFNICIFTGAKQSVCLHDNHPVIPHPETNVIEKFQERSDSLFRFIHLFFCVFILGPTLLVSRELEPQSPS